MTWIQEFEFDIEALKGTLNIWLYNLLIENYWII